MSGKENDDKNSEMSENQHDKNMEEADRLLHDINMAENEPEPEISAGSEHPGGKHEEGQDLLSKLGFKGKDGKHKKEVTELKQQVEELNDKYLRLVAEFDNFKKRNAKERIELFKTAGQDVIQSLLPVLDDFERAVKQMETAKDINAVKQGVVLIQEKLKSILESKGLKAMNSIGEDFDVEHHEAITEIPAPTEEMKGKVVDEVEKGYKLYDKIIRFAKVIVGK
jgi:molecular chaperone GrpE